MTIERETKGVTSPVKPERRKRAIIYTDDGVLIRPDILPAIARFLGVDPPDRGGLCPFTHDTGGIPAFAKALRGQGIHYKIAAVFLSDVDKCPAMDILGHPPIIPWEVYVVTGGLVGDPDYEFQLVDSSDIRQRAPKCAGSLR